MVVLGNGTVESETIELAADVNDGHLAAASAHLTRPAQRARTLGAASAIVPTGDDVVDRLCGAALPRRAHRRPSAEHLYIGGTSAMASAFDAVDIVRNVLRTLEQQFVVVSLLGDLVQRGVSVAIGVEHGVEPLSACSVVVAPIVVDGEHARVGRRARSDPDELPAGAGDGRGGQRPARPPPRGQTDGRWLTTTSCSASPGRRPPTRSSGPTASKARELHPDANPGDAATAERFKEVARAYEVLSDPDQRARYDRFGEAGVGAGSGPRVEDMFGGGGLNDLFDAFFGGQSPFGGGGVGGAGRPGRPRAGHGGRRRRHVRAGGVRGDGPRHAAAAAALRGLRRAAAPVPAPSRSRAPTAAGAARSSGCARACSGRWSRAAPCPRCGGLGEVIVTPCPTCRGEGRVTVEHTYQVDVPAGVDAGSTLRLSGRGAAGPRGGKAGDLYVHLRVADARALPARGQRPRHRRADLDRPGGARHDRSSCRRSTATRSCVVPAGTQPGHEFVLRGRGVPRLQGRGRGDLRAQLVVEVPTKLAEDEAALLRQLAERRGEPVNPPEKGLFSRIKSAFS